MAVCKQVDLAEEAAATVGAYNPLLRPPVSLDDRHPPLKDHEQLGAVRALAEQDVAGLDAPPLAPPEQQLDLIVGQARKRPLQVGRLGACGVIALMGRRDL
jgi:hypothetical protein